MKYFTKLQTGICTFDLSFDNIGILLYLLQLCGLFLYQENSAYHSESTII